MLRNSAVYVWLVLSLVHLAAMAKNSLFPADAAKVELTYIFTLLALVLYLSFEFVNRVSKCILWVSSISVFGATLFVHDVSILAFVSLGFAALSFFVAEHNVKHRTDGEGKLIFRTLLFLCVAEMVLLCEYILFRSDVQSQLWIRLVLTLIAAPFLFVGLSKWDIALEKPYPASVFVSPQGAALSMVGGYLLLSASVSYMSIFMGVSAKGVIFLLLFTIAFIPMFFHVFKSEIRQFASRFVHKYLFKGAFDYRATWLNLLGVFENQLDPKIAAEAGLKIVLDSCSSDSGAYFSFDKGGLTLLSSFGFSVSQDQWAELFSMQRYVNGHSEIIELMEYQTYPAKFGAPAIELVHRWEAGWWLIPVRFSGAASGMFLIKVALGSSSAPTWEIRDFVIALSQQIEIYYRSQVFRMSATEQAQFAAFYQTSAFVIHDLKNIDAQLVMLIENSKLHKDDPEFIDDAFLTIGKMQERLDKTLNQLRSKQAFKQSSGQTIDEWWECSQERCRMNNVSIHCKDSLSLLSNAPPGILRHLSHLFDNSIEACRGVTFPLIILGLFMDGDSLRITVTDNGKGMSKDFIDNRLFKPFQTTKGNAGMGLGLFEVKSFITAEGGEISVSSGTGQGCVIEMRVSSRKNS